MSSYFDVDECILIRDCKTLESCSPLNRNQFPAPSAPGKMYARYQHSVYENPFDKLRRAKTSLLLEEDDSMDEVYKNILLRALNGRDDPWKEKTETCDVIGQRKKANTLKKRKRNDCNVEEEADPQYEVFLSKLKGIDQSFQLKFEEGRLPLIQVIRCKVNRGCDGDDIVQIDKRQAPSSMDHRAVEGLRKSIHTTPNGEKNKAQDRRKLKKVARQGDHKILDRGLDLGSRKSRKKIDVGDCAVKKESDHREKRKIHQDLGSRKSRKKTIVGDCAVKESDGNYLKGKRDRNDVPAEVEILDGNMISRNRNCNPFIPSIKHATVDEELEGHGLPTASNEFRKEALKVIRRPFDKEEYKKCREEVRDKSYTFYYPGLQTKLTKFRYKNDKCLVVLRGFFFWLQNLTREGAFQPWLDKECLMVELPSR